MRGKEFVVAQPDFSALLQQAQAFQEKLKQMQDQAASKTVIAQSGGGMV
jgi:DNA-binding protein YbaB